ncbi:MAG: polyprenyl synthetase family protein [Planctomycetes bacterium]|nr:polyprenyl synthetase family protein [Planctomycetota bacterium]
MHSPDRLIADLKPRQERIDAALREWLGRTAGGAPGAVREAMAYSLFAPGKRLRPVLAALACEAAGGTLELALPAGCAVEMVHTYSLIHDDLPAMDDDDLRRGQPTCHKKYGEALAILAGDALLTAAFEVLAAGYGPRTAAVSCLELARGAGAAGMVGGQVLDLEAEGKIEASGGRKPPEVLADLEDIHARKTGALFRAALRMGVFAAQAERPHGADPVALAAADAYAAAFGLLFQVTDDLLDVESTADKTGKRVGKDAARGKLTYPGLLGVEASRGKAAELGQAAVAAAEQLGSGLLAALAQYVVERDR